MKQVPITKITKTKSKKKSNKKSTYETDQAENANRILLRARLLDERAERMYDLLQEGAQILKPLESDTDIPIHIRSYIRGLRFFLDPIDRYIEEIFPSED
jgi:hypothetical protein